MRLAHQPRVNVQRQNPATLSVGFVAQEAAGARDFRCVAGEKPDYLLTLNVYRVSGVTNGVRAEFSTYVADEEGIPRYMVVEARDHSGSMDRIDIITRASRVEHRRDRKAMTTVVASRDGGEFAATCTQAALAKAPHVQIHGEWVQANDFIYWRNGVRDRCYYDAGMANPQVRSIDPAANRGTATSSGAIARS